MIYTFVPTLLLLLLDGAVSRAPVTIRCHIRSVTHASCQLRDIIRGQSNVNVSVTVNNCHEPVDVLFVMTGTNALSWNFTFVPNNQNERVVIPNVYLIEPEPPAPTFLYVREPSDENRERNGSYAGTAITVQASLMAPLRQDMWEEVEFLNHTFSLPPLPPHCPPLLPTSYDEPRWLIKVLVLVAAVLAVVSAVLLVTLKRRQLRSVARNLVQRHCEAQVDDGDVNPVADPAVPTKGGTRGSTDAAPASADLKTTLDASALRYFNEVYPDERQTRDVEGGAAQQQVAVPKTILQKMMKAKKEVEIGLRGISFERLKEDVITSQRNVEAGAELPNNEVSNPGFITDGSSEEQRGSMNEQRLFPLDDDFGSDDVCSTSERLEKRSDSYTNVFNTGDQFEDFSTGQNSSGKTSWEVNSRERSDVKINKVKGLANKNNSFGYGSREYLDELEGATAVYPDAKSSKKKKSKLSKPDKQKRERPRRSYRPEEQSDRRLNLPSRTKVETIPEVEVVDGMEKRSNSPAVNADHGSAHKILSDYEGDKVVTHGASFGAIWGGDNLGATAAVGSNDNRGARQKLSGGG
ncbi:uncharacterized protein LOC108682289 [Hyalella azteca]|uniref:Uncharacterized protein LOC108682289 n=1 Tax=Hyalella azteca TaxID=294128 RepID=A0A8B7PLQ2_HYAAZ|nr:uncharacterized protein LOC108682289 [Hyalella azteca]